MAKHISKLYNSSVADSPPCVFLSDLVVTESSMSCSKSVSSLDTENATLTSEPNSHFTPPRSIFKLYWEKSGSSPELPQEPPPLSLGKPRVVVPSGKLMLPVSRLRAPEDDEKNGAKEKPFVKKSLLLGSPPLTPGRRSIFGTKAWLSDCRLDQVFPLLLVPAAENETKKASSTGSHSSHMEDIPLTPCLKPSSSFARKRKLSERSVKFSEDVQVRVYSPFLEKHAGNAWIKWFAS